MQYHRKNEHGQISGSLVAIILISIALVSCIVLAVWLYMQYSEQKTNVDAKISAAVAKAERDQAEKDEKKYIEMEKEPNYTLQGPGDYGGLVLNYPKTWSVYIAEDGSGKSYEAYLHPKNVPSVKARESRFALRVEIKDTDYDKVIGTYRTLIERGDLKSSTFSANGHRGTRIDGTFSNDIRGSAVFFKLRDKTISVFTDANTFKGDFEKIIKTIDFKD